MINNVHEFKHKSGLNVIFVPKPGFSERYAIFATKYGSMDSALKNALSGGIMEVPLGIAHFLEHKLFEQEQGNVMADYAVLGAKPNAFTSTSKTAYLFSCANNFEKCLRLLLNYVQNPYFTKENVENEKGIIAQEINMYLDNPDFMVYMNLLKGLYVEHPVRNDIAGTVESISFITPDILNLLYNTFYTPDNMVLVIVGDEQLEDIERIIDESIEDRWVNRESTGYVSEIMEESPGICEKILKIKMEVPTPIFAFGYKDNEVDGTPLNLCRKELEARILLEVMFGRSSDFYSELYNGGLINDTFYTFYEMGRGYAFAMLGGESKEPEKVIERIQKQITEAKRGNVIDEKNFSRIKNSMYGSFIKRFNSVEGVGRLYMNSYLNGVSVIDYFSLYDKIDYYSAMKQLKLFDESKSSISIAE